MKSAKLRTFLTEPRRHELTLSTGQVLVLAASDFLSVPRFKSVYLDAAGALPDFPEKGQGKYLEYLVAQWFAAREVVVVADEEASERGALVDDIRALLRESPESDQGIDLATGAVIVRGGQVFFHARYLMARLQRVCPVRFSPQEYYQALHAAGCSSAGFIRVGPWHGRAWSVPASRVIDSALDGRQIFELLPS